MTGEWTGRYVCSQGITALHLTIQKAASGEIISATFSFGPLPENPEAPADASTMRGGYDGRSRRVRLTGEAWINAPVGYTRVSLKGYLGASGKKISGRVPGAFACTDFEVWRPTLPIG